MAIVYGLYRESDKEIRYIGLTTRDLKMRMSEHWADAKNQAFYPVHRWMAKHSDVQVAILHQDLLFEEAKALEMLEISERKNLFNLTDGGEGVIGYKHTDEVKQFLSTSKAGVARPRVTCSVCNRVIDIGNARRWHFDKCGLPRSAPANKGIPLSAERKQQISLVHKGKAISAEHRQRNRDAQLGKPKPGTSAALKGRKHEIVSCPNCLKQGGRNAMKRFHFDKCKVSFS